MTGSLAFQLTDVVATYTTSAGGWPMALTVSGHDNAAVSGCGASFPSGSSQKLFEVRAINPDGGSLTPGAYPIGDLQSATTAMSDLHLTELTPLGMTSFGGIGLSGTVTLASLTSSRASGTFAAQVRAWSDGGVEPLSGSFDVAVCP